ncbi:SDR family NAD(P)-dependent oxidoreductase [Ruixingdingia sedimenti]|uniref:SDR family NAD(P)-dependent oxidoreductase n=1 Tax=Ruixingdingia sedimenti TaxID=3073604 RepID=A0ABU1F430_9RHOB|nr:SDR family NAD(P)-dependent oxidoreductase [Xinfangfangia sp. LG-4]MDR5651620.1 SDR family NAD(P)-dependent oxidoreductase [Xinfangfangia sp. LG-4]
MAGRLEGKRIIITGAVGNIGKEAVRQFVAEGARVVIGDRDATGADTAREFGAAVHFIQVDVTDEASVRALVDRGAEWLGGLDVLAQNAGLQHSGAVTDFDAAKWDALFAVNARAHFFGAKHAVPLMRKAGRGGSIINTSSLAGKRGGPGMTAYSASKGAVIGFTTALAMELAGDNIRVNAICPGWVDTAFNQPAIDFMGGAAAQAQAVKAVVPLGRQATPAEIAPMFVYLASDESAYMTAQAITIDGGVYNS